MNAIQDGLSTALSNLATFIPQLLLFLVILLIGWLIAKGISKLIDKVLEKVGFDRAVERGGIKKALAKSKYDASAIVGKIVYYFIMLFVLQLAFGVFGPNPISDILTAIIAYLPLVFVAIIILVVAFAVAAAVRELIKNSLGGLSYGTTLANLAAFFIIGLGVIAALNQMNIAETVTTPILIAVLATLAGVLIVGVGGALIKPMQGRLEQYLSKAEEEAPKIKEEAKKAPSVKEQAEQAKETAQHKMEGTQQQQQPQYGARRL
ncbi:mechanosensitive ion channel family protein [Agromyces laixinhei]|uniref:mechanosensitive ion channel family protein n=1 Tax=Agromyces laixinhei TaxID=2585717 RepID=UPI0012EDF5D6|nr:hypothetical protein [Agromyces laixinhei]